ncbi:MAG: endopygalactorunase, partial [Mucilaginibacter sp.]
MKKIYKAAACMGFILLAFFVQATVQTQSKKNVSTGIVKGNHAVHIAEISEDTLVIITGNTIAYNVDTPEGTGLVATNPSAEQLLSEIVSKDGSAQKYIITDKHGVVKNEGAVDSGDKLCVTSADGKSIKIYQIAAKRMALAGQITLDKSSLTINTGNSLTLHFRAGQRGPDATVNIYLPPGINAGMDNTTVNVIGRGDVKLKELATQSIGRTGTHYSYTKVGDVAISKLAGGGQKITFSHLDLRPDNGDDLKIVFQNVNLNHTGEYVFRANYTTY